VWVGGCGSGSGGSKLVVGGGGVLVVVDRRQGNLDFLFFSACTRVWS